MIRTSTVSQTSIRLRGKRIPGAEDRQRKIVGFDQTTYAVRLAQEFGPVMRSRMVCNIGLGLPEFLNSGSGNK